MSSKSNYIKICTEKKGIPLFMQPWWLDLVCPAWDAAVVKNGEEVAGIWAWPIENKMGVSLLRTPMLTPYLGPHIFYPADLKESRHDSYEYETVAELLKQLPAAKVWHLAMPPGMKQAGLFKKHTLTAEVQQTFLIGLVDKEEALFTNIKESARRNIRTAGKEVTISNSREHLPQLYAFLRDTLARKERQLHYSLDSLDKIMTACAAHNACALWVAKRGEAIEAIIWQVWDDNRSYYLAGGQNPDAGSYKAMSLLLWHCIKESKHLGHTVFDLEGSMDEGVERFFRNFGGQRELYMILHKNDSLLWKMKKALLARP